MTEIAFLMRKSGFADNGWLRKQALDKRTLEVIELIIEDEKRFLNEGIICDEETELTLHMKQGTFYTTRKTGHSIINVFVQIFKTKEHAKRSDFQHGLTTLIDVGANEGFYTIMMLKSNPKLHVIAVEPNPIAFYLLEKNIRANHLSGRVTLINKAIWSEAGTVIINVIPQVTSISTARILESSFMTAAKNRVKQIEVGAVTLRDILTSCSLETVDLMKIDIEGGETEALQSADEELKKVKRIVLEYHSQAIKEKAALFLIQHGFEEVMHVPDRKDFGDVYFQRSI